MGPIYNPPSKSKEKRLARCYFLHASGYETRRDSSRCAGPSRAKDSHQDASLTLRPLPIKETFYERGYYYFWTRTHVKQISLPAPCRDNIVRRRRQRFSFLTCLSRWQKNIGIRKPVAKYVFLSWRIYFLGGFIAGYVTRCRFHPLNIDVTLMYGFLRPTFLIFLFHFFKNCGSSL